MFERVRAEVPRGDRFEHYTGLLVGGRKLYVATHGPATFAVVDLPSNRVGLGGPQKPVTAYDRFVAVSPDASLAYITDLAYAGAKQNGEVWVIRTLDNEVIDIIDAGYQAYGFTVGADGRVYVPTRDATVVHLHRVEVYALSPALPSRV